MNSYASIAAGVALALASMGAIALDPPPQDWSLRFVHQQVATAPPEPVFDLSDAFTLEAWIYLIDEHGGFIAGKFLDAPELDGHQFALVVFDGAIVGLEVGNDAGDVVNIAGGPHPVGQWVHVAGTFDAGDMRYFVDGVEQARRTDGPAVAGTSAQPFTVGGGPRIDAQRTRGDAFRGAIRNVRVWSRALSAAEIGGNAGRRRPTDATGLIANWPLDEGSGQILHDRSGAGRDLTRGGLPAREPFEPFWQPNDALVGPAYLSVAAERPHEPTWRIYPIDLHADGDADILATGIASATVPPTFSSATLYENDGSGRLTDVTDTALGLFETVHSNVGLTVDLNADELDDLFILDKGTDTDPFPGGQNRLLVQNADGTLIDRTADLPVESSFSEGADAGDVNGDGDPDLAVAGKMAQLSVRNRILVNRGDGVFVSDTIGLPADLNATAPPEITSAALFDADRDLDLDLYMGDSAHRDDTPYGLRNAFLLNDGSASFTAAPDGAAPLRLPDATWATNSVRTSDYDLDGWPDLLAVNASDGDTEPYLQLLLNRRNGKLLEASDRIDQRWPPDQGIQSFNFLVAVDQADINDDGWTDLLTEAGVRTTLFMNKGLGFFADESHLLPRSATDYAARFGDADADADADIFLSADGALSTLRNDRPYDNHSIPAPPRTDLAALADVNGNGSDDFATLRWDVESRRSEVLVRDGASGERLGRYRPFDSDWRGIDLAALPSHGAPALALLAINRLENTIQALIIDPVAQTVSNQPIPFYGPRWRPQSMDALSFQGQAALAVLALKPDIGRIGVEISDAVNGARLRRIEIPKGRSWLPLDFTFIPDVNGDNVSELALLVRTKNRVVRVVLYDVVTGSQIGNLKFLDDQWFPYRVEALDDVSGNDQPEIVVLAEHSDGRQRVEARDSTSGERVNDIDFFFANWSVHDLLVVPDIDGNDAPEIAVLGRDPSDQTKIEVRDSVTDQKIETTAFFSVGWYPYRLVGLGDSDGNGVADVAVLAARQEDGTVKVSVRDPATGSLIHRSKIH